MSSAGASLPAQSSATARGGGRAERCLWAFLGISILLVIAAAAGDGQATVLLGLIVAGLVLASYQRVLLAWQTMLAVILLVIIFIPIRRYNVGWNLPIELEP